MTDLEYVRREAIRTAWRRFRQDCDRTRVDVPTLAAALSILVGDLLAEWPDDLADKWLTLTAEHVEERRAEVS